MRLFHVSEEQQIAIFEPRPHARPGLAPDVGLVWAINERCLPNFLTPRNCPRVCWHVSDKTRTADIARFMTMGAQRHVVAIERSWHDRLRQTTLYMYEFAAEEFVLCDEVAGYYVSTRAQRAVRQIIVADLEAELAQRGVELRVVESLWPLYDAIQCTSFNWSMCRMRHALPSV